MAEKLFIADKKTLDEVNKKLDNFSGGTDWSKYKPFYKSAQLSKSHGQEREARGYYNYNIDDEILLSIEGSGYIDYLYLEGITKSNTSLIASQKAYLKCIFDDITMFEIKGLEKGCNGEITITSANTTTLNLPCECNATEISYTTKIEKTIKNPLFFKKSIKVICKAIGKCDMKYASNIRFSCSLGGGIK